MNLRTLLGSILLLSFWLLIPGCSTKYIPNTDVEDSEDNRRVVVFCEKYRKAVEHRDVGRILSMVSPRYYEDGGNVDSADDLDFAGLRKYLSTEFRKSKAIRYEIRYRRVIWNREKRRIYVDFTYSASFKILGPDDKDEWRRMVSENRLELIPVGEDFKIMAGM